MRNHQISLIILPVLVLASCGGLQITGQNENLALPIQETLSVPLTEPQPKINEQPVISPSPIPTTYDVQSPDGENATYVPRKIIEKVKAHFVNQFGVSADQIRIKEATAVNWPDASLGCSQPDVIYAQVITPGYWILLEAKGHLYPYHTDENEQIVLCLGNSFDPESELPLPVIPVNPDEILDGQPWMPVD